MRNRTALVVGLTLLVALTPVAPGSLAGPSAPAAIGGAEPGVDPAASLEDRLRRVVAADPGPAAPVDREVYVEVRVEHGTTLDLPRFDLRRAYDREGARVAGGYVPLTAVRDLSNDPRVEAVRIERARLGSDGPLASRPDGNVAAGVSTVGADRLHLAGITGRNVTVGVIDADFRVSDPELAGHVGAYRSFGPDDGDDDWVHGTAVASVVADTAPGSSLHLAAVGDSTTPGEYRDAVAWLRASGADVIVDAGSYFGQPGDGSGGIAAVAAAASRDVVFVAAAGNYAERHWRGDHVPRGDTWVRFAPGTTANSLEGGAPFAGTVRATLRWDDWNASGANRSDYELRLFRRQPGTDTVVATGSDVGDDPVEHLVARVPRGRYYLAVRAVGNGTGTDTLDLFANRGLAHRSPGSSLTAPGTGSGVLTVGALAGNDTVASFSSRGPVAGTDRLGVDLVAPDDVALPGTSPGAGSSYAAPYAAGAAALLVEAHPSLSPAETRAVLRNSAVDVGPRGPDPDSGYGRLDASAAAEFAVEYERYADVNASVARDGSP